MDLESIMLNEISQRQILYDLIYMWNLKTNTKKKRERERSDLWLPEIAVEEGELDQGG